MSRATFAIAAIAIIILALSPATFGYTNKSVVLSVYGDGYVLVTQSLVVDSKSTTVQVPLLSAAVSNLVATDQNGSPLSYGFNPGGSNITVYTLGATSVTLRYDSNSLTAKNGTVWTLTFSALYNSTVMLPQLSTLVSVSGTPYSINETNSSPVVSLSPGTWRLSYGVSLGSVTSSITTVPPIGSPPGGFTPTTMELVAAIVVAAAAAIGFLGFSYWRAHRLGPLGDLRPDDVQVLNFIQEKGGRVLEPEIRMKFALPKTSAWRQIKRLERLGYVKVTKIGSQNQIELLKERSQPA